MIQELDSKQRKIRSLRGFFLYVLEIIENGEDLQILSINLQPFFWKKIQNIIQQNKKASLQEFLFGKDEGNKDQTLGLISHLQDQNQTLQNQVDSIAQQVERLQQQIIQLESKLDNSKYPLNGVLEAPDTMKSIQFEKIIP